MARGSPGPVQGGGHGLWRFRAGPQASSPSAASPGTPRLARAVRQVRLRRGWRPAASGRWRGRGPVPPSPRRPVWKGSNIRSRSAAGDAGAVVGDREDDPSASRRAPRSRPAARRPGGCSRSGSEHRLDQLAAGAATGGRSGGTSTLDREVLARACASATARSGSAELGRGAGLGRAAMSARARSSRRSTSSDSRSASAAALARKRRRSSSAHRVVDGPRAARARRVMPAIGVLNSWLTAAAKSRR